MGLRCFRGPDHPGLACGAGGLWIILVGHRRPAAKETLQGLTFPQAHVRGDPAPVVFAPGPGLRGHRLYHGFQITQAVTVRIVPFWIKDHRPRKKLRTGQHALPPLHGEFVFGQAPARIEGLPEHPGLVACEDRLEPHL